MHTTGLCNLAKEEEEEETPSDVAAANERTPEEEGREQPATAKKGREGDSSSSSSAFAAGFNSLIKPLGRERRRSEVGLPPSPAPPVWLFGAPLLLPLPLDLSLPPLL